MKTVEEIRTEILRRIESARLVQTQCIDYGNFQYFNGKINSYDGLMRFIDE